MNKKFYYFRDSKKRPIITLCKIEIFGKIGYGWSICSKKDNPCKRVGRSIAWSRAYASIMLNGKGYHLDDTQNIFVWKRPICRPSAVIMLGADNPLYGLSCEFSTKSLPESMKP